MSLTWLLQIALFLKMWPILCYIICLVHYSFSLGLGGGQLNHYLRNNNYHHKVSLSPQFSQHSKHGLRRCKPNSSIISDECGVDWMPANVHRIIIAWHWDDTLELYGNSCQFSELAAKHNSWDKDLYSCHTRIWILYNRSVKSVNAGRHWPEAIKKTTMAQTVLVKPHRPWKLRPEKQQIKTHPDLFRHCSHLGFHKPSTWLLLSNLCFTITWFMERLAHQQQIAPSSREGESSRLYQKQNRLRKRLQPNTCLQPVSSEPSENPGCNLSEWIIAWLIFLNVFISFPLSGFEELGYYLCLGEQDTHPHGAHTRESNIPSNRLSERNHWPPEEFIIAAAKES